MFRKVVLILATLAIISVAFVVYQWRDDAPLLMRRDAAEPIIPLLAHASQPSEEAGLLTFRDVKVPPGESPRVRVFDNKGNVRIAFQSTRWKPVSDTRFHLTEPSGRLLLPGGQLAYVWADEGEVEVQKTDGNNFNPRQGWLRGHVRIFVDRSKPEWRAANPDRVEPEQHPELLVKMWLDDVDFDLDIGRIESQGPILVQSPDGMLQGRGLQLVWNEATRQIKLLRILKGDRAWLRTNGLEDFGIGGGVGDTSPGGSPVSGESKPSARRNEPSTRPAALAQAPADANRKALSKRQEQLQFRGLEEAEEELRRPREDRIDTYRIEFRGDVLAEQKDLARTVGHIRSAVLQLVCDIGRAERERVEHGNATRPAGDVEMPEVSPVSASAAIMASPGSTSRIELRWTGELVAIPEQTKVTTTNPAESTRTERFHLLASGSPVEIFDRQSGHATCSNLEYQNETRRVWLRGTAEKPAQVMATDDRQLIGQEVFFDRQLGIARVQGAGQMLDAERRKDNEVPPCLASLARAMTEEEQDSGASDARWIRWSQSAQVEFALAPAAPESGAPVSSDGGKPRRAGATAYLKKAVFDGQVQIRQGEDLIHGDRVEALFVQPKSSEEVSVNRTVAMDRLKAEGNVRMVRGGVEAGRRSKARRDVNSDEVTCNRLEVQMTVDDTGRNVPEVGRAFGDVIARRSVGRQTRQIRAADHLEIHLASRPKPATPEERQRLESKLRECNFGPDSLEWQAVQTRLERRRRIVTTRLVGAGDVAVVVRDASDASRNVDLSAQRLDCTLEDDEDITKAFVMGSEDEPATVDLGDVYARGPQISLDMIAQSMEIPGAGRMRFMSKQDLAGRPVDRPVPVLVDWTERMSMRGQETLSPCTFRGKVHAISGGTTLDCRELRIEFRDLPEVSGENVGVPLNQRWILRPIFGRHEKRQDTSPTAQIARQMRKEASYIRAVGDAVIVSTEYAEVPGHRTGPLRHVLARLLPGTVRDKWEAAPPPRGPIASRFRVIGPQIGIDLVHKHFGVEGAGNLLIEDRRLPSGQSMAASLGPTASMALGSLDGTGPSQTLFQWESSMTFLNERNLAQFDRRVVMDHASGEKMAFAKEVLAALKADHRRLSQVKSQQAHLACDNLLVEFKRDASRKEAGVSPLSGITEVKTFEAKGHQVLLDLDEGRQSVTGSLLSYSDASGELRVLGSPEAPAQIMIQDEKTGQLNVSRAPPGEPIIWNQRTRTGTMTGTIRGTGR